MRMVWVGSEGGGGGARLHPSLQEPKSSIFPDPEANWRISVCLRAHFP